MYKVLMKILFGFASRLHFPSFLSVILAGVVCIIILIYALPLIGLGLDDVNMIRHFDHDEFILYDTFGKVYINGPLYVPTYLDPNNLYPKFFYNFAGLFLYPYTVFFGEDLRVVFVTWRSLNMFAGIVSVVVLFLLIQRVCQSTFVGFFSTLLFVLTPEYFRWLTDVRPNPFEQMLIFISLLFAIRLCKGFKYRWLLLASLFGALAFSTKYGGIFLLVFLPLFSLFVVWRLKNEDPLTYHRILSTQILFIRIIIPTTLLILSILLIWFMISLGHHNWNFNSFIIEFAADIIPPERYVGGITGVIDRYQNAINNLLLISGLSIVLLFAILVYIQILVTRVGRVQQTTKVATTATMLFFSFTVIVGLIYLLIYLITNPVMFANPAQFIINFTQVIYNNVLGGGAGEEAIRGYGRFEWFRVLSEVTGGYLFLPVFILAVGLNVSYAFKRRSKIIFPYSQKNILYAYSILTFIMTFILIPTHFAARHILPIIPFLYMFVFDISFSVWKQNSSKINQTLIVVMLVFLTITASVQGYSTYDYRRLIIAKPFDTGLQIGEWLKERYDVKTRIMTDSWTFYIPPLFEDVVNTRMAISKEKLKNLQEKAMRELFSSFDPEVIIIADSDGKYEIPLLSLLNSGPQFQSQYNLVNRFEYNQPARRHRSRYYYAPISIYEKKDFSKRQ